MSVHNAAVEGQIAESVLVAGDPLRAKFISENYLTDVSCYNKVRNMFGYTGLYKGKRISVQGSGMGMPSMTIYIHELIQEYHVQQIMRIGSCGSFQEAVNIRDLILAVGASTDSAINRNVFNGNDFSATATFSLLKKAAEFCEEKKFIHHVGNVLSSDVFYSEESPVEYYKQWIKYGVLAVEMESNALYTLGARYGVDVLSILTVSDNLRTMEHATAEEREQSFDNMMKLALEIA